MNSLKTFKDWSYLGYTIKKGSKAHWVDGVAMFDSTQVKKYEKPSYHNNWHGKRFEEGYDHDELAEAYGAYGSFWDHM